MKVTYVNGLPIIEIEDFLCPQEVEELLQDRKQKFCKANSHYPSYYRNNDRLEENNPTLSTRLFDLLQHYDFSNCNTPTFTSLNSKLRFCKYGPDQTFVKHQDGVHYQSENVCSRFTFLLYLNENTFSGGETTFYTTKTNTIPYHTILPKRGKLVVFDHRIWHQGNTVHSGDKYILRSDLMALHINSTATHHNGYVWTVKATQYSWLLSGGRDKAIRLWDKQLNLIKEYALHNRSILQLLELEDGTLVSCSRDFTIVRWNLKCEILAKQSFDEMFITLSKGPNDTLYAGGTSGSVLQLNDKLEVINSLQVHNQWVWKLISTEKGLISVSDDCTLCTIRKDMSSSYLLYTHHSPLFSVASIDRDTIVFGDQNGKVGIWNHKSAHLTLLAMHKDIVRSILVHKQWIFSCSEDGSIKAIDKERNVVVELYQSEYFIHDIDLVDERLLVASYSGEISVIHLRELDHLKGTPITELDANHQTDANSIDAELRSDKPI